MIFYTRQNPGVLAELTENGLYHVREEYIREKYTTITDHYASLYRMLTSFARGRTFIPDGAIYEGFYILANNEVWDYMINHLYYPESRSDEIAHEAELERYGISSPSSLVGGNAGNFYPLLRKKVTKSWEKIFTVMPDDSNQIVGLAWELRREWLI